MSCVHTFVQFFIKDIGVESTTTVRTQTVLEQSKGSINVATLRRYHTTIAISPHITDENVDDAFCAQLCRVGHKIKYKSSNEFYSIERGRKLKIIGMYTISPLACALGGLGIMCTGFGFLGFFVILGSFIIGPCVAGSFHRSKRKKWEIEDEEVIDKLTHEYLRYHDIKQIFLTYKS